MTNLDSKTTKGEVFCGLVTIILVTIGLVSGIAAIL